jgi:hypothetical protein
MKEGLGNIVVSIKQYVLPKMDKKKPPRGGSLVALSLFAMAYAT